MKETKTDKFAQTNNEGKLEGFEKLDENRRVHVRIYGNTLGYVQDVAFFLEKVNSAYNSALALYLLIDEFLHEYITNTKKKKPAWVNISSPWDDYVEAGVTHPYTATKSSSEGRVFDFSRHINRDDLWKFRFYVQNVDIDSIIHPDNQLFINKIQFSSPGFWEFLANLNPIKQLEDFITTIVELRRQHREDIIKNKKEMYEILIKRTETINALIDSLKKAGYSELEIRSIVNKYYDDFYDLVKAVDKGQITKIEIIDIS